MSDDSKSVPLEVQLVEHMIELARRHGVQRLCSPSGVEIEFAPNAFAPEQTKVTPPTEKERREAEERRKNLRRYGSSVG